jgi:predicted transcriptional regulator
MKTTNDKLLQESTLRFLAKTWTLGRVLLEHSKAGMSPTDEQELNEREELALRLMELFPGQVTETTLVKVFDLHYSQVAQIVERFSKLGIIEKKTGRGAVLKLTKTGETIAQESEVKRGYRFAYICNIFNDDDLHQLKGLMQKMYDAAYQQIEVQVFGKLPRSIR